MFASIMASHASSDGSSNGSWVELGTQFVSPSPVRATSVNCYYVERLLREAQRESSLPSSSCASSRALSPQCTPNSELEAQDVRGIDPADWVWDWSSRPEIVPPSDYVAQLKHPEMKWKKLSIRNTRLMDAIIFSIENLPILLFTHACTFVFGAATMLIILRKYFNWSAVVAPSIDG